MLYFGFLHFYVLWFINTMPKITPPPPPPYLCKTSLYQLHNKLCTPVFGLNFLGEKDVQVIGENTVIGSEDLFGTVSYSERCTKL
jgi:hypothetical protein